MRSYDIFVKEIVDIRRWLFTTIYSYNRVSENLSECIRKGVSVEEQVDLAFNEEGCNEASLVKRLAIDNIKTCKELALIRSISALEVFTVDSVKEVFNANKSPFLANGTMEYPVGELLSCTDISELQNKYIEQKCRNLHSCGFDEIQKYYKKTFKIEFSSFSHQIGDSGYGINFLQQYHQMRHLVVHRLGRTDEQYRKKYNTEDSVIKLFENELSLLFDVLLSFAHYVDKKMSKYILTPPAENVVEIMVEILEEQVLEYLEPTFSIKIKKEKYIPLSMILKSKEVELNNIYKIRLHGTYAYIRKYYKILRKREASGELKILNYANISLAVNNTKVRQYSWDEVEKVINFLPERPWEKHIHKKIAEQLGWPNNKVSGIISYIENEKPVKMSIGEQMIQLHIGEKHTFKVSINPQELSSSIIWQNSNSDVVEMNNETIMAIAKGKSTVIARIPGNLNKAVCIVTVIE